MAAAAADEPLAERALKITYSARGVAAGQPTEWKEKHVLLSGEPPMQLEKVVKDAVGYPSNCTVE
jgi:hypothetical protein